MRLDDIIRQYTPRLQAFIRQWMHTIEDTEDIMQDVFYQLARVYGSEAESIDNVSAWLYSVARNTIINNHKKRHETTLTDHRNAGNDESTMMDVLRQTLLCDDTPTPETVIMRKQVWKQLEEALDELPDNQRLVFELSEMQGMPMKDIAEQTGIKLATLLSRKHYAVLHLRKRLAEIYEEIITQ